MNAIEVTYRATGGSLGNYRSGVGRFRLPAMNGSVAAVNDIVEAEALRRARRHLDHRAVVYDLSWRVVEFAK